ncbi:ATPase involved in DNA repair/chromosome segregation, partial [Giardia duodenalis]
VLLAPGCLPRPALLRSRRGRAAVSGQNCECLILELAGPESPWTPAPPVLHGQRGMQLESK